MSWLRLHPKTTVVSAFAILIIFISISSSSTTSRVADNTRPSQEERSITSATDQLTCERFAKFYKDIGAGILTDAEAREQVKSIYDKARNAKPELNQASIKLLSSITNNDTEEAKESFATMTSICSEILK